MLVSFFHLEFYHIKGLCLVDWPPKWVLTNSIVSMVDLGVLVFFLVGIGYFKWSSINQINHVYMSCLWSNDNVELVYKCHLIRDLFLWVSECFLINFVVQYSIYCEEMLVFKSCFGGSFRGWDSWCAISTNRWRYCRMWTS
jgi:hypothetical protein